MSHLPASSRSTIEFVDPATARRVRSRGRARRRALAIAAAIATFLLVPALALAHPLGNFTINHFAALRIAAQSVSLDVVVDRAEIPAFQEQQRLDGDGDGSLSSAELAGQDAAACRALLPDLRLSVGGERLSPSLTAAGLARLPGAGGLSTVRLVCEYEVALIAPIAAGGTEIAFEDASFAERIGWREIVVAGDGVTITGPARAGDLGGVSARLTSYPSDLLQQPLDQRSVAFEVTPGGASLPAWTAPDAASLTTAAPATTPGSGVSAVPGGIGEDLAALVDVDDLTPVAILVSLAIAFGLGIVHALSPGHGKTIMAAYLVGGRGSSRQAVGLGLAVAVSHTLGVLALAAITLAASSVLPPERLYPILGIVSGGLVILIGGSLLWGRVRGFVLPRPEAQGHAHDHSHDHDHEHDHGDSNGHSHPHPHSHGPAAGEAISWRGLLALGLSGGLVPSASALILLLGSIAAGRVAYGLVLVVGFGLGMAVVLAGIGLLLVHARRFVERRLATGQASLERLRRAVLPVQVATAGLVVLLGVVLTGQALTQFL